MVVVEGLVVVVVGLVVVVVVGLVVVVVVVVSALLTCMRPLDKVPVPQLDFWVTG